MRSAERGTPAHIMLQPLILIRFLNTERLTMATFMAFILFGGCVLHRCT